MENLNPKETAEGLNVTTETPVIETQEAKESLESTENVLLNNLESLSALEKLDTFGELESKCAEIEGRNPRAVEAGTLETGDFKSENEKVTVDSEALSEMPNLSEENISALKSEVFSHASETKNSKNVAFGSISFGCSGCSGSCSGDCAGSTKCYATKS